MAVTAAGPPGACILPLFLTARDARSGERINYHSTHTPLRTSYTSPDIDTTSSLALASVPVFSAADQSLQSMEDLVDIKPLPHVIDYRFDRLVLSLDPT